MAAPVPSFSYKTLARRIPELSSSSSDDDSSDLSSDDEQLPPVAPPPLEGGMESPPCPASTPPPSSTDMGHYFRPSPSPPPSQSQALVVRRPQPRDDSDDDASRFIPIGKCGRALRFGGGKEIEKAMVFWRTSADNRKEFHRICNFNLPMITPMVVKSHRLQPKYNEIDARHMVTTCRVYDPNTPTDKFDPKTIDETTLETWFLTRSSDGMLVLHPIIAQWAVNLRKEIAARRSDTRIRASVRKDILEFPGPNECRASNNIDDRRTIKFGGIRCLSPMSLYRQNEERRVSRRPLSKRRRDDSEPLGDNEEDEGEEEDEAEAPGGEEETPPPHAAAEQQEEGAERGRPRPRTELRDMLSNMEARLSTSMRESHDDIMSKIQQLLSGGGIHTPTAAVDRWCVLVKRFVESRNMSSNKIREWRARMDGYAMSKDPQETMKRIQKAEGVEGALAPALYAMAVFCSTNTQARAVLDELQRA